MTVGFIGQGYVGKHMADDFAERGISVARYALEPEYVGNKDAIARCSIVFIAVPTPTTPEGFDARLLESVIPLTGESSTVVIKSTVLPGTTERLQQAFPSRTILFSPEFLSEKTAAYDAQHPMFNIVGVMEGSDRHALAATQVLSLLPQSEETHITPVRSAELFKYIHNIHGFMRVVFANMFYDLAETLDVAWSDVEPLMNADRMMSPYYNSPVHKSGRGAGGHCFIKDMAAFTQFVANTLPHDHNIQEVLHTIEQKNRELLIHSGKDLDLLSRVYGSSHMEL